MKYRLVHVDPLCAARLVAVLCFVVGIAVLPFLYYGFVVAPQGRGFSRLVILLTPFLLAGCGLALSAIASGLFNWLAGRFGGLEVELLDLGAG
ncbi:MAG TPA: hypothetical protein VFV65_06980 [Gemmatimonadales bacterium]|nr:hypothetical protein [Gemmatimonadales bacterium]